MNIADFKSIEVQNGVIAELLDCPQRTLQLYTEQGFVVPAINSTTGTGDRRLYNFQNILDFYVVNTLSLGGMDKRLIRVILQIAKVKRDRKKQKYQWLRNKLNK